MHRDQSGNASALGKDFTHTMARPLRRGHAYVDAGYWRNSLEVNVETVREKQHLAGREIRSNLLGIELCRGLIGDEDHDNVCPLYDVGNSVHLEAGLLRLGNGL